MKTKVPQPKEERRLVALNGRVPFDVYQKLEELRHRRSMATGHRVSQRDLFIEAIEDLCRKESVK